MNASDRPALPCVVVVRAGMAGPVTMRAVPRTGHGAAERHPQLHDVPVAAVPGRYVPQETSTASSSNPNQPPTCQPPAAPQARQHQGTLLPVEE